MVVVDEYEVVAKATNVWTRLGGRSVDEVWVCQLANEGGNLWPHTVLGREGVMRESLENQALEK
jgi:hypothetical protein